MAPATPDRVVRAIAAYGLPGASPLPDVPLPDEAWRSVLELTTRDRLTPLLGLAVADGALAATPIQQERASAAHEQSMRLCVLLERSLLETAALLDASQIAFRVLKGPAVAHL